MVFDTNMMSDASTNDLANDLNHQSDTTFNIMPKNHIDKRPCFYDD